MADLNPLAKRIHNVSPDPVRLTLDDGTAAVFRMASTEFFQQEFQAEGSREDDAADYRLVSSEDNESILVGRQPADAEGWEMIGTVVEAEAADGDD
ncbi:transcriptional regulator [Halonotius terrestris]|uniref:Transcriptional regulator n=1 Tax=Halonotius terrestris TaxID=2487750 RepID=A0A8J8P8J7_9EURY|nr:transcriptional regulator [Halonotius terrestris]TQQ80989.1 transcriptional regulator [Halonotius terrestris]